MASQAALVFFTMYHFIMLAVYCFTFFCYFEVWEQLSGFRLKRYRQMNGGQDPDFDLEYGGSAKFLTVWSLNEFAVILCPHNWIEDPYFLFQTFYFFWCCVTDLVLTSGSRSPIAKKFVAFRDWFLAAVAFPIGTMVVAIFWAIWAVDRELIFPKELDEFFPAWLNHVLHTTVLPILLVEMFLVQHKVPSRKAGFMGTLCVGLAYLSWILYLGYVMDIWVYPVLRVLSGLYFALFLAVSAVFLLTLYIVGEKITSFFWRGYPDSDYEYTKID